MKQRIMLLVLAALAVIFFSACSASLVNTPASGQPTIQLHPIQNLTPTPTAPPYTIGEWVSNETPNVNANLTVYVIFHLGGNPVGGATVALNFYLRGTGTPIVELNHQVSPQQTAADGMAAFPLTFTGLTTLAPVLVDITVSYNGQNYVRQGAYAFTPVQPSPTASPPAGR